MAMQELIPNYGGGAGGFGGFGGGGFSSSGFGGFEDIFDSFFGGGGGRSVDPNAPRQGADLQYTIQLKFEKLFSVSKKRLSTIEKILVQPVAVMAPKPGTHPETCHKCHGSGTINVERQTPGRMMSRQTCDVSWHRKEIKEPCPTCHGTGHEKKHILVKVNVPAE